MKEELEELLSPDGPLDWRKRAFVLVVMLVAIAYFVISDNDPLGLFTEAPAPAASALRWEVFFTEPNAAGEGGSLTSKVLDQLLARINAAQETIDIAAFEFDLLPVAEALISAEKRGVEVRFISDDEFGFEEDEQGLRLFPRLRRAGGQVRVDDRTDLMHNKFIIFDERIVWTGSTNLTQNGLERNNNNVLVVESPEAAAVYAREFEEMWAGHFGPTSPSTLNEQALDLEGTALQILFAPEDNVMDWLVSLVSKAQSSIRFMAFSITRDDLGEAIRRQAAAGVDVAGIVETRGSETMFSELGAFICAGIPVRQDGNPATFHHKVIIIDRKLVVTGSLNFSDSAAESNDENVILVANRQVASLYNQEFEQRWQEASPPDPERLTCP